MKSYKEIDINKTLIIILKYNHFFIIESFNSFLNILKVYKVNKYREFIKFKDVFKTLTQLISYYLNYKCLIKQFFIIKRDKL